MSLARFLITVFIVSITSFAYAASSQAQRVEGQSRNAPSVPKEPEGAPGGGQRVGQSPPRESRFVQQKGALERFKEFQGEKTPAALVALFSGGGGGITQDPSITIADGQMTIQITVNPGSSMQSVPTFALKGARVISIKPGAKGGWSIEAQPVKGAYEGAVTVLTSDSMTEYPLTFAPPTDIDMDKSGSITENDFEIYLERKSSSPSTEKMGTADGAAAENGKAPAEPTETVEVKRDLNGDGKEDYIDDYIFTANYLVATAAKK